MRRWRVSRSESKAIASHEPGAEARRREPSPANFQLTFLAQRVRFGLGAINSVGDEARELGRRILFVCTPSLADSVHATAIRASLGEMWVADFTGVAAHVPLEAVDAGVAAARQHRVDLVVALGGGSAIGAGKAIAFHSGAIPLVAIPTTYAGSEMTPVVGMTDLDLGQKRTVSHPRILPRATIYDPEVTVDLPPSLTASTGINALAHCVEAVYSRSASPLVRPVALDGAARIARALPRSVADGADLGARSEMLIGAFLAGFSLAHAGMALHHGLCHSLGGKFRLAHGIANAIMLPQVMRYNADAVAPALAELGAAMGMVADAGDSYQRALRVADGVYELVGRLGLPQRLRDVGLAEEDLAVVAADAIHSPAVQANPKPITGPEQLLEVLRQAW